MGQRRARETGNVAGGGCLCWRMSLWLSGYSVEKVRVLSTRGITSFCALAFSGGGRFPENFALMADLANAFIDGSAAHMGGRHTKVVLMTKLKPYMVV